MSSIPFRSWPPAPRPTPPRPQPGYDCLWRLDFLSWNEAKSAKRHEFRRCFEHGYKTIQNPGTALECGLYALIDSLYMQIIVEEESDVLPDLEVLRWTWAEYKKERTAWIETEAAPEEREFELDRISNDEHFGADQLAIILNRYGRRHLGLDLALGLVIPGEEPNILDVMPDAAHAEASADLKKELPVRVIWVANDNMELLTGGQAMSHYEGMKPLSRIEAAREKAKKVNDAAAAARKKKGRRRRK
ncbi:hypothetical protein PpBr36_00549 [Pyricularia pennisetigena]|uniref:hypothetical protein n=1 Tax=Pyricularia pennisetigena TaxID=1578925 RepID=UPI001153EBC7|nr:hypothetical protein PpBr36_00549 [Pyricularia pennisetigena]TLS28861.1 hypothetical protein PpBr36_00549 [Pyricularia pennisetigena]